MEEPNSLPKLSAEEVRVLGALIEKSKATPEYYPMTINGPSKNKRHKIVSSAGTSGNWIAILCLYLVTRLPPPTTVDTNPFFRSESKVAIMVCSS